MYQANESRYEKMIYRNCGKSGLKLPRVSLGMWHNFGSVDVYENCAAMVRTAFDLGITHFDLANNYGPVPGSAEITFGRILKNDLKNYRDELFISSKAGYTMWPGPYGDFGSRKYIIASCDQSLKRLGLDYVDIFYHHRFDPDTPMEESLGAVADLVRSGKALYAGISNYNAGQTARAAAFFRENKIPFILNQLRYNIFDRRYEKDGLFDTLEKENIGGIVFSPLEQGLLSGRYLDGIPADSRAARDAFLKKSRITPELVEKISRLNQIAEERGQSLAAMAINWVLRQKAVTSVLLGASRPEQIREIVAGVESSPEFSEDELARIDEISPRPL